MHSFRLLRISVLFFSFQGNSWTSGKIEIPPSPVLISGQVSPSAVNEFSVFLCSTVAVLLDGLVSLQIVLDILLL